MVHGEGLAVGVTAVGLDVVPVGAVAESLRRFGERYAARVFTTHERASCAAATQAAGSYAQRFAAKEAVIKALGSATLRFTDIEIRTGVDGRVAVALHGDAIDRAAARGVTGLLVSMSGHAGYAAATAIGLRSGTGRCRSTVEGAVLPSPDADPECRVPLLDETAAFPRAREIYRYEQAKHGRVRNLTRATAGSVAAWQTTTRALQIYGALRKIDRPLVDLLCLYVSLLNGCRYCIDDAAGEAIGNGWQPEQLLALGEPHGEAYPPATVAALGYAGVLTDDAHRVDDGLVTELRQYYDDEALLEITAVVAMKNFWNRFATALRVPPEGKCRDVSLLNRLVEVSLEMRRGEER